MAIKKQPTPPGKKYTAKDSVNYRGLVERQASDGKIASKRPYGPKADMAMERISKRFDSISSNPYFNQKAKTTVVKKGNKTTTTKKLKGY